MKRIAWGTLYILTFILTHTHNNTTISTQYQTNAQVQYKYTSLVLVSLTHTHSHTITSQHKYCFSPNTGPQYQSHKTTQSSGTMSLGFESQPNKNPASPKLAHHPTKQRECVRMIIMTDNKKN